MLVEKETAHHPRNNVDGGCRLRTKSSVSKGKFEEKFLAGNEDLLEESLILVQP